MWIILNKFYVLHIGHFEMLVSTTCIFKNIFQVSNPCNQNNMTASTVNY